MSARPFSSGENSLLESHLLQHARYRNRILIIAGTQIGYRITELLTWTLGQVFGPDRDIAGEVALTCANGKGCKGHLSAPGSDTSGGLYLVELKLSGVQRNRGNVDWHRPQGQRRIRLSRSIAALASWRGARCDSEACPLCNGIAHHFFLSPLLQLAYNALRKARQLIASFFGPEPAGGPSRVPRVANASPLIPESTAVANLSRNPADANL